MKELFYCMVTNNTDQWSYYSSFVKPSIFWYRDRPLAILREISHDQKSQFFGLVQNERTFTVDFLD